MFVAELCEQTFASYLSQELPLLLLFLDEFLIFVNVILGMLL